MAKFSTRFQLLCLKVIYLTVLCNKQDQLIELLVVEG